MLQRVLIILFIMWPLCMQAQESVQWEDAFMDYCDPDEYDATQIAEIYERLVELEAAPLNINDATYSDFVQIPGLDIGKISDIMWYRDRYGEMKSMEELALITSIDRRLRLFLSCFFEARPVGKGKWWQGERLDTLLRHGHGKVMATLGAPLYSRKGDSGDYLGDKYKYSIKMNGKFAEYITYGFAGAKESGEPFMAKGNRYGFDYYSYYININKVGRLRKMILGQYRVRLGEGLVMNNGFSLGKQTFSKGTGTDGTSITGHASRSDGGSLQGLAANVDLGRNLDITAFASYRWHDATLNKDGSISTVSSSSYHRTVTEMNKKNNTEAAVLGGRIGWKKDGWHLGISGVYDWFNREIVPPVGDTYRKFSLRGNSFWNAGTDYGFISRRLCLSGETAVASGGGLATMNRLQLMFNRGVTLTCIQRYYSYRYHAVSANAFSDGGTVSNETGVYLGVEVPLRKRVTLAGYTDYSYSPWMKYNCRTSSYSWDNNISLTYKMNDVTVQGRYRFRVRERNDAESGKVLPHESHAARLSVVKDGEAWTLRTQADLRCERVKGGLSKASIGMMISQTAAVRMGERLTLTASGGYFKTDDFSSRVYGYERGMLDSFGMVSFYGHGCRAMAMLRTDLSYRWMLMAKVGMTKYFDRDRISSGMREIYSSLQTDVDLQLRMRF